MVDGGGGNTILHQLKAAGINWMDMRDIFVTHKHIDHLLGIIWMMRMILQNMNRGKYEGEATIYGHEEVIRILKEMAGEVLSAKEMKYIDDRLHMVVVEDGEEREIIGKKVTFFDIHSTKAKQFGFCMRLDEDEKLTCCGDEPNNELEQKYAENSTWLLHEAFCLYGQADEFKPYEKHHSTVKDEVVIVGYGAQKKATLSGSVTSVGGEKLAKTPVTNVFERWISFPSIDLLWA